MSTADLASGPTSEEVSGGALGTLFEVSPAPEVTTSAAAVAAFVLGVAALLAVPFSLALTLSSGLACLALVTAVVGMARASRPRVAGGVLASLGLVLGLATLAVVGLRYAGIDTAFGDGLVPQLHDWLVSLNGLVPAP